MKNRLVHELAVDGTSVAVACRVLGVSESGYYEWRGRPLSARAVVDASLSTQIVEIHAMSRGTYGVPRVHAELRLGRGVRCGRKRVARLMRAARLHGIYRRHGKHRRPAPAVHDDLVRRRFVADAPDRVTAYLSDQGFTEHQVAIALGVVTVGTIDRRLERHRAVDAQRRIARSQPLVTPRD